MPDANAPQNDDARIPEIFPEDPTMSCIPTSRASQMPTGLDSITAPTLWGLQSAPTEEIQHAGRPDPGYTLRRRIGRGGCGEVWEALQASLHREVAIKVIRPDVYARSGDPDQVAMRESEFRQEAFTTAHLEHPNIVPVHDLGHDGEGRPLLAMKLVRGKPWNELLKEEAALPVADFLARHVSILIAVSQAVAFAHSKGVVHRDLKPSQVMVGEFGEVLLMDWGLALVTDMSRQDPESQLLRNTLPTSASATSPAGTFAYMAPEQTETSARNVGTWTDVFLLGATLYTVLCGFPPHEGVTAREVFYNAMEGKIRAPELRSEGRDIPSELSALAMRAMARHSGQRIPSARDFIAGLQDYLTGAGKRRESTALTEQVRTQLAAASGDYRELTECQNLLGRARGLWAENPHIAPLAGEVGEAYFSAALKNEDLVLARVQTLGLAGDRRARVDAHLAVAEYRHRARERQRTVALAASIILVLGLGAFGVKYTNDVRAERDRTEAARVQAEKARGEERAARADAEDLVGFMIGDLKTSLDSLGRTRLLKAAADKTQEYFAKLDRSEEDDALKLKRARSLFNVGDILNKTGETTEALALYRQVDGLISGPLLKNPANENARAMRVEALLATALVQSQAGGLDEALEASREARRLADEVTEPSRAMRLLQAQARSGAVLPLVTAGRSQEALDVVEEALRILGELEGAVPDPKITMVRARMLAARAICQLSQAHAEQALADFEEAMRLQRDLIAENPESAQALESLSALLNANGKVLESMGRAADAERLFAWDAEIAETLVRIDPLNSEKLRSLRVSYSNLAIIRRQMGKTAEARAASDKSLAMAEQVYRMNPANMTWASDLATAYGIAGDQSVAEGDNAKATDFYAKAGSVVDGIDFQRLGAAQDTFQIASLLLRGASHAERMDDRVRARTGYERVLAATHAATDAITLSDTAIGARADAFLGLMRLARTRGDVAELRRLGNEFVAMNRAYVARAGTGQSRRMLVLSLRTFGTMLSNLHAAKDGAVLLEDAVAIARNLPSDTGDESTRNLSSLRDAVNSLGVCYYNQGAFDKAREQFIQFLDFTEGDLKRDPTNKNFKLNVVTARANLAATLLMTNRVDEGLALARKASALGDEALKPERNFLGVATPLPKESIPIIQQARSWSKFVEARLQDAAGNKDDAAKLYGEAVLAAAEMLASYPNHDYTRGLRVQANLKLGKRDAAIEDIDRLRGAAYREVWYDAAIREAGLQELAGIKDEVGK